MADESSASAQPLRIEQFETLFNTVPFGIYVADSDFRICAINKAALPAFGDIPGGAIGRDLGDGTVGELCVDVPDPRPVK